MNMNASPSLDRCLTFINCQVQPGRDSPRSPGRGPRRLAVTLSRQTGCDAAGVAEHLRALLQADTPPEVPPWTVFDQNLLEQILADHHLPKRLARFMPEDRVSWITDTMEELFGLHPSAEVLVRQTAETILHLAELGRVIIIGRGGNVITANRPHVLSVRLVGSVSKRVERLTQERPQSPESALTFLRREDEARRRYLKTYYHADIDDPVRYHLTMNTDAFDIQVVARLIANALG
jgi:cytidylate kinase